MTAADLDLPASLVERFVEAGVAVIDYALDAEDLAELDRLFAATAVRGTDGQGGVLAADASAWISRHGGLDRLARLLGRQPMSLLSAQAVELGGHANWFARWHRGKLRGALESGPQHGASNVTLRVYLDDCCEDHGPLEVIPGSQCDVQQGRKRGDGVAEGPVALCLVDRGDIIALRPLVLRRSQKARIARACRVISLEYEPARRPTPWH